MDTSKHTLVQKFIGTFATLKRVIHRFSSCSFEEKIATALQFQALTYLHENTNCTVGMLAHELGISSSAVAQLIDRLIIAHRIERKHDEKDRRIIHISLTPEGKKELTHITKNYIEKMSVVLSHISEKDLSELIRIQAELINKLEEKKLTL